MRNLRLYCGWAPAGLPFADRFDLQMLVQIDRGVARGTVARLVAEGQRNARE